MPSVKVAVPREIISGERRVALVPADINRLAKLNVSVLVEAGAGEAAWFLDADYEQAGAIVVADTVDLYEQADIILKVRKPVYNEDIGKHEIDLISADTVLIAQLDPL